MKVALIDYGVGNVQSVLNSVRRSGGNAQVVETHEDLTHFQFDRVIFPGVGAIGKSLQEFRARGLDSALKEAVLDRGIPLLGICVGMQMLFQEAEEFGTHKGLGLLPGRVVRLNEDTKDNSQIPLRLPHVGWNTVTPSGNHPLFENVGVTDFYFVHSYAAECDDNVVLARTQYGHAFPSAVGHGAVLGVQFHPEKSSRVGEQLIRNFLAWQPC